MFKFKCLCIVLLAQITFSLAQTPQIATITVGGDADKWYPVTFVDDGWAYEVISELEITRFNVHQDYDPVTYPYLWKGSMVAQIKFHSVAWGNSSAFIDVDLKNYRQDPNTAYPTGNFIAGWQEGSWSDNLRRIIIWLKGNTTYNYRSNVTVSPTVYLDPSTLNAYGGPYSYKTAVEPYVNIYGRNEQTAFFGLDHPNYFKGSVGIGTISTGTSKLAVEGTIAARKIRVTQASPFPDYVFEPDYSLRSLDSVEVYIKQHKHLPEIVPAKQVESEGLDIGENQTAMLKKIEELTLYIIQMGKCLKEQQMQIQLLKKKLSKK